MGVSAVPQVNPAGYDRIQSQVIPGYGSLARLAVARKAAAVSWIMMGWNTEARRIYEANGASIEDGTCYCKLSGEALERLAS